MKLYLSVDMEGITGIPDYTFLSPSEHNYERSRRIMTNEVNHVIETALEFGCQEVLVKDSHSKMNNILIDELHPEASLITGDAKPFSMVQGLDNTYDGAMFIGYHARASQFGVLSHSMIHAVRHIYINEHEIGEMGFNAYVAGFHGIPILLVSGDDQAVKEAKELIPNVTAVAVKETISRSAVKSMTPEKAEALLRLKVKEALENRNQVEALIPPDNPLLRIEFNNYGQAEWANLMPKTWIEPGTTIVGFEADDILEAYQAMLVMIELALQSKFS